MENGEYVERIGGLESGSGVCGETKGNPTSLPIPPPPHTRPREGMPASSG